MREWKKIFARSKKPVSAVTEESRSSPKQRPPANITQGDNGVESFESDLKSTPASRTSTTIEIPHPPHTYGESSQGPVINQSTGNTLTTVANGLSLALTILKAAVTGIGLPGLEGAVNGVVQVIDIIKNVRDNGRDLSDLSDRISGLSAALFSSQNLRQGQDLSETLRVRVTGFLMELQGMLDEVYRMLEDRNIIAKTANSQANKDAIASINARMDRLLSQFSAEGIFSLELDMAGARRDIVSVRQAQNALTAAQHVQEFETLIEKMPRVHARYRDTSTKPTRPCHPGTRAGLLKIIGQWIEDKDAITPFFWLCGEVGVGKSTVAHTIAQEEESRGRLGASFFFSRHDADRQSPHLLFPSIAYQLARFDEGMFSALGEALKPDPDVVKSNLQEQFKRLILEPLSRSDMSPSRTVVIVIDGLDECSDPASILDVLAEGVENVGVRLRLLISSRPYSTILSKFEGTRLYHLTSQTKFRDINPQILSDDVSAFLSWSLRELASRYPISRLPSPWPSEDQLTELIERASGLFIIASTYVKYLEDPNEDDPAAQLERILSRRRGIGSSPLAELDALYDLVLLDLRRTLTTEYAVEMARNILSIVLFGEGGESLVSLVISVQLLASCLFVPLSDIRSVLRRLTSVILLPNDNQSPIVPFHASFGEYIQDPERCTVRDFSMEGASIAHGRIAERCFDVLISASKDGLNGAQFGFSSGWFPPHLQYAAAHLSHDISRSDPEHLRRPPAFQESGFWTWLTFLHAMGSLDDIVKRVKEGGFDTTLGIAERSFDAQRVYICNLMMTRYALEIQQLSDSAPVSATTVPNTSESRPSNGSECLKLKLDVLTFPNSVDDDESFDEGRWQSRTQSAWNAILNLLRDVRCWVQYKHSNIISFKGVDVEWREGAPYELRIQVATSTGFHGSCTLQEYFTTDTDMNHRERLRFALGIAEAICCLHESPPPEYWHCLTPHRIRVSAQGRPFLYPAWNLDVLSASTLEDQDDAHVVNCWIARPPPSGRLWQPTKDSSTLNPNSHIESWAFGFLLYQVMSDDTILMRYDRVADGSNTLGYDPVVGQVPFSYWFDRQDTRDEGKPRYEEAMSVLVGTIHGYEDAKKLLEACWVFFQEERPSMREVVERLKSIIEAEESANRLHTGRVPRRGSESQVRIPSSSRTKPAAGRRVKIVKHTDTIKLQPTTLPWATTPPTSRINLPQLFDSDSDSEP